MSTRLASQWTAAVLIAVLLTTSLGARADAKSYDGKISDSLLAQVKLDPKQDFAVIVRAAADPTKTKEHQSARAADAVSKAHGKIGHGLSIVGAVSATLKGSQILALARDPDVAYISSDDVVTAKFDPTAGASLVTTPAIQEVGAPAAWTRFGVTGKGIGVAILDSGIAPHVDLGARIVASVDFTSGLPGEPYVAAADPGGHGTHVAGIVAGDGTASGGAYTGVAPGANLIDVRVIGATGATTVSTLIRGMQWVLAHRAAYNIRVANLSAGAPVTTSYENDPLAAAAEVLILAGVSVVVSAGNSGPGSSTITTPGSDPYVITVGAVDDNATATLADDTAPAWSSRGPTAIDGVAKPDLVAPGRRIVSLRSPGSTLDRLLPDRQVAGLDPLVPAYFRLTGTSMAAPIVAGVVALMVEGDPTLTPMRVKARLVGSAVPLAFGSPTTTGSGLVSAVAAVDGQKTGGASWHRVADALAGAMFPVVYGQSLHWIDLTANGGVDTTGRPWSLVDWGDITWDQATWANLDWAAFDWGAVTWQEITWEEITWETATTDVNGLNGPVSVPVD